MPTLSLPIHCLRQIRSLSGTNNLSDPAHEIALRVIFEMLNDNSFGESMATTIHRSRVVPPRPSHCSQDSSLEQCQAGQRQPNSSPLLFIPSSQPPLQWIGPDTAQGPKRRGTTANCARPPSQAVSSQSPSITGSDSVTESESLCLPGPQG